MLVLTRRLGEKIVLPDLGITIQITDIDKHQVRLGIDAPRHVTILREEVLARSEPHRQRPAVDDPLVVPST